MSTFAEKLFDELGVLGFLAEQFLGYAANVQGGGAPLPVPQVVPLPTAQSQRGLRDQDTCSVNSLSNPRVYSRVAGRTVASRGNRCR